MPGHSASLREAAALLQYSALLKSPSFLRPGTKTLEGRAARVTALIHSGYRRAFNRVRKRHSQEISKISVGAVRGDRSCGRI